MCMDAPIPSRTEREAATCACGRLHGVWAEQWEGLLETERAAAAQEHWEVVYAARQLRRQRHAYLHSAGTTTAVARFIPALTSPELGRDPRYTLPARPRQRKTEANAMCAYVCVC
jgi:hypothetical protein